MKKFIVTGAIHAFLAVALGAFAAHGLKDVLDVYSTGDRKSTRLNSSH